MRKVLITGGSGFVGGHLIRELEDSKSILGSHVVKNFDFQNGNDIRNYEEIRKVVDYFQPDLIFHLAAQAFVPESSMNPNRGISVNLIGTLNLLEAVRQTGNQSRILVAGTSEEYGYDRDDEELTEDSVAIPTTPYGVSKLAATTLAMTYARNFNMNIVATRAWNHIGPGASPSYAVSAFAKRIAEAEKYGTTVKHGNLESIRNYTDVKDIISAYIKVIECESGIYNIAGENTVATKWILEKLAEKSLTKIIFEPNDKLFRPMSLKFPRPNCSKLRKHTNWTQKINLEKTLEDILNDWRKKV
jgi:GDP-4-dehydro-6-deoxy-D-mannose reductase